MKNYVIASGPYWRGRYRSRTINRIGLKPKPTLTPTLSRKAEEGVSFPLPFGERGGGEGQAVHKASIGQIGFMERGGLQ